MLPEGHYVLKESSKMVTKGSKLCKSCKALTEGCRHLCLNNNKTKTEQQKESAVIVGTSTQRITQQPHIIRNVKVIPPPPPSGQQPPGVVRNWSTLQCSKHDIERCGYDHAPVTRGRMRTQLPLPHGPPSGTLAAPGIFGSGLFDRKKECRPRATGCSQRATTCSQSAAKC